MLGIFEDTIKHKADYLRAETGEHFEDRFERGLRSDGYSPILKRDISAEYFSIIKNFIVQKQNSDFLTFKKYPMSFIRGPFGSQNYPDFIVFTGKYVIPVEIKYSKESQTRPIWNSGIPRANGIYIFGSYKKGDITFFLGGDVLNKKRRTALINFFEGIKAEEKSFKKIAKEKLPDKEKRGFMPYVRRAYDQEKISKDTELNYFSHPKRWQLEKNVIITIRKLQKTSAFYQVDGFAKANSDFPGAVSNQDVRKRGGWRCGRGRCAAKIQSEVNMARKYLL